MYDYTVSVLNPAQAHYFAKAQLRRAKTDVVDAQLLTQFALERRPPAWTPPPPVYHELRQRLVARAGLLAMRQQARNPLHALRQWPVVVTAVQQHLAEVLTTLDGRLRPLDREIEQVLADGAGAASAERLQSIAGVGLVTAAWVLVATVNVTTCATPAAAAQYAGLAPLERRSGTTIRGRPRSGHGGQRRLRTARDMATLSAAQHNPVITTFYTRLRDAGKPKKVARWAAARKLLHLAFAVVTTGERFNPSFKSVSSSLGVGANLGA